MIRLVICEPHKLIYCPVSKCASTTLFRLLGELGGADPSSRPRHALPAIKGLASPGRGGSYVLHCGERDLADLTGRYAGYFWFSVVRDPYGRVVSNYHNKINRYARRFAPGVYLGSYLRQALGGPSAWKDGACRIRSMQARISFDQFVRGLHHRGVGWDRHFMLQAETLRVDEIRYQQIVKMEHLAAGLGEVFSKAGVGQAGEDALARLGWLNRSGTAKARDPWSPASRALVAELYRRDFEALGYPM